MTTVGIPVVRWRGLVLAAWLAGAVALGLLAPRIDPAANERASFLPDRSPHSQAAAAMRQSFPASSGLSEAVVVFERRNEPLRPEDLSAIERLGGQIPRPSDPVSRADLAGVTVRTPGAFVTETNPLKSPATAAGQAALIVASVPANFITLRSDRVVEHIYHVLSAAKLPEGMAVAVTGSSGFGHDYADAAQRSHTRTLRVTLAAVIVILLLVYRAPAAALVPLTAISLAAFVAMKVLAIGQQFGMHVGTAEEIFVIVLLYGAGTDYSLFFISRFREFLDESIAAPAAAGKALDATFPAILASAGTNTVGLLMLCVAEYGVFRTTGPAVAVALVAALAAATTLVPALVALTGRRLFWPGRPGRGGGGGLSLASGSIGLGGKKLWSKTAALVTARPVTVLAVTVAVLAIPAWKGIGMTWVYDTLAALERNSSDPIGNAAVGIEAVKRHWPVGEIAPVHVLVKTNQPRSDGQWRQGVAELTGKLSQLPGVAGVRSLTWPLGKPAGSIGESIVEMAGWPRIKAEYLSRDMTATRLAVILEAPAFSLAAMETVGGIRQTAQRAVGDQSGNESGLEVHLAGATAEMIDIKAITQADFCRVAPLCLGVIFVMVLALVRDAILSAFIAASTVLTYLATLGISYWVFVGVLHGGGLDWKVEVFLFVVMVAVGVDYSIFLVSRLSQEASRLPAKLATSQAVIHTGPVISSCGLIMAATLGSLMAGDLQLLKQLGFALALGMLIDTFVVRPLLLPAFVAWTKRTGKPPNLGWDSTGADPAETMEPVS